MTNVTPTFSIEHALSQMPAAPREQCQLYLRELDQCLRTISSYTLRDDSRLAFRYASGSLPPQWTPWVVAHEMACTQYLSDSLPYHEQQQAFLRSLATTLKTKTNASWQRVWAAVADLGPEILKLQLMGDSSLVLPDLQPAAKH